MPLLSGRSPAGAAAFWAFLLHALGALWIWWRWGSGLRSGVLFWMDFPVALLYAGLRGNAFFAASLAVGGAWWALLAAGLTRLVGRSAARG
ncbi:MAG TPA: hypothetical protein VI942_10655 [Thermoanaerobaculia bacterium]|nr:hypothetical protein [Thermoanaerobaculia bacterium]